MTSQCTAQLLADLGVTRSLSRPQVSDDNPFSEAQFKTLKYHPSFPGRFGDQGQAKTFCRSFFRWYNAEHRHGGIFNADPRAGPLRAGRRDYRPQDDRAQYGMDDPSRTLRQRRPETQTAPGGRLDQSSHHFPLHTGNCSLINPVECPIVVDRFRRHAGRSDFIGSWPLRPLGFIAPPLDGERNALQTASDRATSLFSGSRVPSSKVSRSFRAIAEVADSSLSACAKRRIHSPSRCFGTARKISCALRNLSTTMGHSTGLIREQFPVWRGKWWED